MWGILLVVCLLLWKDGGVVEGSHVFLSEEQSVSSNMVAGQYRTGYHFQPPRNWINDPNGPMFYNGIYHLFYQYNPHGSVWGNITWAHSVSTDLINWKHLEPAINPTKPFDINGTWSGSATILPGNKPAIFYTGIDPENRQVQNIAFPKDLSDPYLREWVKPDYNPLISPTGNINASAFRDPTTAWCGPDGRWRLVVGSKRGTRGMAIMYRSKDFVHWVKAKHPLHSAKNTGMWECPDFFPVSLEGRHGLETSVNGRGVKHVLKASLDLTRYEYYTLGNYYQGLDRYVPDNTSADDHTGLRYDYGNFYASKTFFDSGKNRRILWGWSNESDTRQDDIAKGWAGIQAIPRRLWLHENGRQLVQWPVEEVETLRGNQVGCINEKLRSGELFEIKGIPTAQADVEVTFNLSSVDHAEPFDPTWTDPQVVCGLKGADVKGGVGPFGLHVLSSSNLEEKTSVFFRVFKAKSKHVVLMCHDPTKSSLRSGMFKPTFGGFVDIDIAKTKTIALRSLIDVSVVESFGENGITCITSRVYPTLAVGADAHLFAFNNGSEDVNIKDLQAWQMKRPLMN